MSKKEKLREEVYILFEGGDYIDKFDTKEQLEEAMKQEGFELSHLTYSVYKAIKLEVEECEPVMSLEYFIKDDDL